MNGRDRRVVVTGVGLLTTLGDSPASVHAALCAGRRGLRPMEWPEAEGAMPALAAGALEFDPRSYLATGNLRPLDRTARLAAAASGRALEAAGWTAEMLEETEVGLTLGTMFGSVHTISGFDRRAQSAGPNYAKPMDFANSVINAAAGQTAIWHNLWGVNATISGGTASGLQAIAYASDLIRTGRAGPLLAGGADELCFESFLGFYKAGLLHEPDGGRLAPAPLDAGRSGLTLGEAAAFLMLEPADTAEARGATILAEIRGHGTAYDVGRGREPESAAEHLRRAVEIALEAAGCSAEHLDCAAVSANGSVSGDRVEAVGLARALGPSSATLPVSVVKSMLGETLGSAGALQAATVVAAFDTGELPGNAGLERLDEGCPLGGVVAESRQVAVARGLVTALGLEGKSTALVIEAWRE